MEVSGAPRVKGMASEARAPELCAVGAIELEVFGFAAATVEAWGTVDAVGSAELWVGASLAGELAVTDGLCAVREVVEDVGGNAEGADPSMTIAIPMITTATRATVALSTNLDDPSSGRPSPTTRCHPCDNEFLTSWSKAPPDLLTLSSYVPGGIPAGAPVEHRK